MTNDEKIKLIEEALADTQRGKLCLPTFVRRVTGIVDPPSLSDAALQWGLAKLVALRGEEE